MRKSRSGSKIKPAKSRPAESAFVVKARRAIRRAQHSAERENARYGLPLIVQR